MDIFQCYFYNEEVKIRFEALINNEKAIQINQLIQNFNYVTTTLFYEVV